MFVFACHVLIGRCEFDLRDSRTKTGLVIGAKPRVGTSQLATVSCLENGSSGGSFLCSPGYS